MCALHIVSIDFKLRLGIDLGVVREQQVASGLLGVSLLRVVVDDDELVKYAALIPSQKAVVKLPAVAMRAGMLHQHVVVHVLPAIGHEQAVDQAFASLTCQPRMHVVADKSSAEQ